jgi:hypothetical protein
VGVAGRNDDRRLAAEFQRNRHQVLARRPHHRAPDRRASGEQQMIERQRGECGSYGRIAGDYGDLLLGKCLR